MIQVYLKKLLVSIFVATVLGLFFLIGFLIGKTPTQKERDQQINFVTYQRDIADLKAYYSLQSQLCKEVYTASQQKDQKHADEAISKMEGLNALVNRVGANEEIKAL